MTVAQRPCLLQKVAMLNICNVLEAVLGSEKGACVILLRKK